MAIVAFALLNWLPARRPSDRLRYAVIWTGGAAALSIMLNNTWPFLVLVLIHVALVAYVGIDWARHRRSQQVSRE